AGLQRPHLRHLSLLRRLRGQRQDHERGPRLRGGLRTLSAERLEALDLARARHEQLPPAGPEPLSGGQAPGARGTHAAAARRGAHVTAAAADDVEPAWDRSFHRTRDFFRGYRDAEFGHALYNFGSLDGGVGSIWNAKQIFFVASGMKYVAAIPEIYNHAMAA